MPMEDVQCGDEKFVSILLLVASQMSGVRPDQVEELVKCQRGLAAGVKFLEQMGYLADQAASRLRAVVTVSKKVVSQQRSVDQRLYDAIHEAGAPEIDQSP